MFCLSVILRKPQNSEFNQFLQYKNLTKSQKHTHTHSSTLNHPAYLPTTHIHTKPKCSYFIKIHFKKTTKYIRKEYNQKKYTLIQSLQLNQRPITGTTTTSTANQLNDYKFELMNDHRIKPTSLQ